jgi:hypothetical protein
MPEPKRAGLFRYLKEAFAFRWNLLLVGGATAAAFISGHPDIAMPLIAAAEITYLAGLTSLPRFQSAIDAKARSEQRGGTVAASATDEQKQVNARERLGEVMRSLSDDRRNRFLRLRARCAEMQRIANAVRGDMHDASGASQQLRTPALDRLLWVFLRLLLSQQAVARFVQTANEADIDRQLGDLQTREQARVKAAPNDPDDRILRSLRDSIATVQLRKENMLTAKNNSEFIIAELDRIENKIAALSEMSVNSSDPDALSAQVDAVAEGISQTEATIRELQNITGMSADQTAPAILMADVDTVSA